MTVRALVSTAWGGCFTASSLGVAATGTAYAESQLSVDGGTSGLRRIGLYASDCRKTIRRSRDFDVLIVATAGLPTVFLALARRLLRKRSAFVVLDFLVPKTHRLDWLIGWAFRSVDSFVCVRSGDIDIIVRRFGYARSQCHFLRMPAFDLLDETDPAGTIADQHQMGPDQGPYVYAAGDAHRDWPMFISAMRGLPYRCVVASRSLNPSTEDLPPNIEPMLSVSPAQGRDFCRRARVVVMPFQETELACGPTIVVDALALGKAIVATDTNAAQDYIEHGHNGLLARPGNAQDLAEMVSQLMEDEDLAARLGQAGRDFALHDLQPSSFSRSFDSIVQQAVAARRATPGVSAPAHT